MTDDKHVAAGENKLLSESEASIFEQVTREADIGELGILTADGYPRVLPLNFVAIEEKIYFHGARRGEKFEAFTNEDKVTFSIRLTYSMIPSYWRTEKSACSASQFFKSVLIRGRGKIVDDTRVKAIALQALMEKCQPEGGFVPVSDEEKLYRKSIDGTAIFRIDPEIITVRSKLGENLSVAMRKDLIERLTARNESPDRVTAAEIRKMLATGSDD